MFGRPRCREWTPLTTQQLRLRSLIQIVGYNIRPPEWCNQQCSYYLTLHHTTMSAPFYTSERIHSPHPKWKEIDSEITQNMSSTNVVIRIWCHIISPSKDEVRNSQTHDTVIQTWGVYFSGLRYIGANLSLNFNSDCFKSNTLVFQMQGGYFCSYKSLKLDIIPLENELDHGSLSSDSSGLTNISKTDRSKINESSSLSPKFRTDKEYSKSHSPVDRSFKQNIPSLRTSSSLYIKLEGSCEKNYIYVHSPETSDVKENSDVSDVNKVDLSETAESYDLRNEIGRVPKYRYMALNFLKSEIRQSYNANKLQNLHLLQYAIKKKQDAVQDIKERIYKKSALYDSVTPPGNEGILKGRSRSHRSLFSPLEEALHKSRSSSQSDLTHNGKVKQERPNNEPRLTLKLNDLLSYKIKPSPFQRSEHIRLTKQLEILHFKRLILSDERDSKLASIRRLKEMHAKLLEENQDVGVELMQEYHTLSKLTDSLKSTRESCAALREVSARSHAALGNCRSDLMMQLHAVFDIKQKDQTTWTICDVPLPICDDSPRISNPLPLSVAAGMVAQVTALTAALLNQPLRYKISLMGSATKILDVTDLPDPNIPLFARAGDATLYRYGMFLLNKCIAQLLYARGLSVHDMRPTLANLQRLLTTPSDQSDTSKLFGTYRWLADGPCARTQSLRSLVAAGAGAGGGMGVAVGVGDGRGSRTCRHFNRFKDCVSTCDGQSVLKVHKHKHTRSVGSYHDDQEPSLNTSTALIGSESNIYKMKVETDGQTNSDTDLPHHHLYIETEKLLKISSNNEDYDVQRMCADITEYCANGYGPAGGPCVSCDAGDHLTP